MLLNDQTTNYSDDPNRLWVEIDRGLFENMLMIEINCISSCRYSFERSSTTI